MTAPLRPTDVSTGPSFGSVPSDVVDRGTERRADHLAAACPDAVIEIDRRGTVIEWNGRAEEWLGWTRPEVLGGFAADSILPVPFARSPFALLLHDVESLPPVPMVGIVDGAQRGHRTVDLPMEFCHSDGRRIRMTARLSVLGTGRGGSVVAFLRPEIDSRATVTGAPRPDELTGLADRSTFGARLATVAASRAAVPGSVAVVLLDLDRFKAVNDAVGHGPGDAVLAAVARRLRQVADDADLVARRGGDEFLVLLSQPTGTVAPMTERFIERFRIALEDPFAIEGVEVFLTASIGVALNTFGTVNPDELLAHAEAAMYDAKQRSGFDVVTFGESLRIQLSERRATEHHLHRALERAELTLHYQPVVDVATAATVGVEALIRWNHPHQGMVPPGRFIPVAEESGLIIPIGAWVIEQACLQLDDWNQKNQAGPPGSVEVNLSARQIDDPSIVETVRSILARTGLPPEHLTLEITESALMRDAASALLVLKALKELGVLLAIDDFGTGYSSLSYLQRFPLDVLKVDRMFVAELGEATGGDEIVAAVIQLAHALGLRVVAEGVETERQLEILQRLECDFAQGFLFSKPVPASQLPTRFGQRLST